MLSKLPTSVLRSILPDNASLRDKDPIGRAPLHLAVEAGVTETLQALLDSGPDVEQTDMFGWTPLLLAVALDQRNLVPPLLEANARLDSVDQYGRNVLSLAAEHGRTELLQLLLGLEGISDRIAAFPMDQLSSALAVAVACNNLTIVDLLLKHGADPDWLSDKTQKSPRDTATSLGNLEIIDRLRRSIPRITFSHVA